MQDECYRSCRQCPRSCKATRDTGEAGFCGESAELRAALACLHFGEEPLITVGGGSGTIFLSGCTLRCAFCQNYQISQQGMGTALSQDDFVKLCLRLQDMGAENINLVTGSHHIPRLAEYIRAAKEGGMALPFAWNSSAYESPEMLELLRGLVDIWLPDLKTLNAEASKKLFAAEDYPAVAQKAILWMLENSPMRIIHRGEKEKMLSGTIIRHLFLPGRMDDSIFVLDWLKKNADGRACVSLMSQYTPVPFTGSAAELQARRLALSALENRLVNAEEDETLRDLIDAYDFDYLFYQDLSDDTSWLPDFSRPQPFSNALATPAWHWREGVKQI